MNNFNFRNPTRILFGQGQIAAIAQEIPAGEKVLVLYGGGSIKKNGVLDQVRKALSGHTFSEFEGIEPNPSYETLMKAVEQVRREGITYLLAVGGGSVGDGSKFVAAAACFEGADPWDILEKNAPIKKALPLGCVLTLPATGTESNGNGVITRRSQNAKLAFASALCYPVFSVLDPSVTFTLPAKQVANGLVDAFVHICEQYLTTPSHAMVQDRYAESLLKTLIEVAPVTLGNPTDYDARANFMWAATQALNGLLSAGVKNTDWSTHMIGHELTAMYNMDHAQTLAVVLTHNWRIRRATKRAKLLQYAERVWNLKATDAAGEEAIIDEAIARTEAFFESTGLATKLSALNVDANTPQTVADRLTSRGYTQLGENGEVTPAMAKQILDMSMK